MNPTVIRPSVSPKTITKVTRLFNGTIGDILGELLQNSRRAGASRIDIACCADQDGACLTLVDDGTGVADPQTMIALGDSGWSQHIHEAEDPAGMGVFSLAGKDTRISTRHADADTGWSVHVPADGWTGAKDIAVVPLARPVGTTITFLMPGLSEQTTERILREVAKFYPLPVFFNGAQVPREDFLAKAIYIAEWNGSQIGVFEGREYHQDPTTNFHGMVLTRKLASVSESLGGKTYHARLDIGATPGLALVLPARKEFVENAAFAALQAACKRTIYAALAHRGQHRLSFENWKEARDLGVALPEADPCLPRWHAAIAESDNVNVEYEEVAAGADTILVADLEPDIAQGLERALREHPLRPHLVENHPAYAGYGWYDALHQLGNVRFYVSAGEQGHVIAENGSFPPLDDHVRAETIELRFCVFHRASETQREERIPADVAFVMGEDGWYSGVDQIRIAFVPGPALTPETLVDLIENVCFCASDDSEADSWDTQHEHFLRDARELAARVLLGEDEAIAARIRDTLAGILWVIPKDRQVAITVAPGTAIDVQLSACQPAG